MPIVTTTFAHMYQVGDIVSGMHGSRWRAFLALLCTPRATVVIAVTTTTFETAERRMTWAEWRLAMRLLLT